MNMSTSSSTAAPRARSRARLFHRLAPAALAIGAVTLALALLAGSIGEPSKSVAARIPPPDFSLTYTPEGDLWLRGRVGPGMRNQFARVRDRAGKRVILTSAGGSASDGIAIAELIRDAHMHTVVRGACYSSCANYLFFAGVTKTVEPGGLLGFHGWPRAASETDRARVSEAILRRRPEASDAELEVAFRQFEAKSAADMERQTAFYAAIGTPNLPRLMRVLDAEPIDYPTGRPYRGGRLAIVPTKATLERCFGVKGITAYYRPSQVEAIDWASRYAPTSSEDLQLVWTRAPEPDCRIFARAGSDTRPGIERRPEPRPPGRSRRIRVLPTAL
jgi:hypothetical protein